MAKCGCKCGGCGTVTIPNNCPPPIPQSDVDALATFNRIVESSCYTPGDAAMNIYAALSRIAQAFQDQANALIQKGYASALIHFQIDAQSLTNNQVVDLQFSRAPFNYKVTGLGFSCKSFPSSAGIYSNDDQLRFKLWNYTSGAQIASDIILSPSRLYDKRSDQGSPIGDNIGNGSIFGVKMVYTNTDGGAFTSPVIDVYLHVEPQELIIPLNNS